MGRQEYVDAIKSAAQFLATRGVVAYLIAQLPFLGLPVVRQFVEFFVGRVVTIAINETEFGAFFEYIDTRVNGQSEKFDDAALAFHRAKQEGNQGDIEKTKQALIDNARPFLSFRS